MPEAYEALANTVRQLGEAAGALAKRIDPILQPMEATTGCAPASSLPSGAPLVNALITQIREIDAIASHIRSVEGRCVL